MAQFKTPSTELEDTCFWLDTETPVKVSPTKSGMVWRVRELGYSDEEVNTALSRLEESKKEVSYSSLIDMAYMVQNEMIETHSAPASLDHYHGDSQHTGYDVVNQSETSEFSPRDVRPKERTHSKSEEEQEDMRKQVLRKAIMKRKQALRAAIDAMTFMCQVCRCSKATILMLPCGHLASCDNCLMDIRRCPVARCNKIVRGTKEVFFV